MTGAGGQCLVSYIPSVPQFLHQVNGQVRGPLPREGVASSSERKRWVSALSRPGGVGREAGVREPRASCSPVLRSQDCPPGGQTCASRGQRGPEASCGRCPLRCGHPASREGRGHLQRPQHVGDRALWGGGHRPPHNRDKDFKSARTWRICGFTGLCGWGAGQAAWGPRLGGTAVLARQRPRPRAQSRPTGWAAGGRPV